MKNSLKRIAHISDTHIRNLQYHEEYKIAFKNIYNSLKEEHIDYIVHTGDLAHTKTQLSPEYFELATSFLKNLADIAPTIIILGNHDGNLKNDGRQDAITPIVEALNHTNLKLLKNSGEYSPEPGLTFNVLSVFDRDNWSKPSTQNDINIALYHGAIAGSLIGGETDYSMDHGEDDVSIFKDFDYAMLGDIHRTQALDLEGRVWYAGSTIQQGFGESLLKGYLIWNIMGKDKFSVEKKLFMSPRPFITVEINENGTLPEQDVPKNSRLRLICNHNIPSAKLKRISDFAQAKWSPYSVQFINRGNGGMSSSLTKRGKALNLRDIEVQKKLFADFLSNKSVSDEVKEKVNELISTYFTKLNLDRELNRNIVWKLDKMEWNNLFNYGEGSSIDFSKLKGLVGIFGKNYSGKSSIIDSALFGLFNTTSKGERKNAYIINQNKDKAICKLKISVGDDRYEINRSLEKKTKSTKGTETIEAKTELDFSKYTFGSNYESKNGTSRTETDDNIRKTFGTFEDFLMTSVSSQNDNFGFINEGVTKQKEILAKFLDLQMFDEMNKEVKKESADKRAIIKHLNSFEWEKKLKKATSELQEIIEDIEEQKTLCDKHKARLEVLLEEKAKINEQVLAASGKEIDIDKLQTDLKTANSALKKSREEISTLTTTLEEKRSKMDSKASIVDDLRSAAIEARNEMETLSLLKVELKKEIPKLDTLIRQADSLQSKIDTLHDHEYDPNCKFCCDNEFVKQAEQAKIKIVEVNEAKEKQSKLVLDLKMKSSLFDETSLQSKIDLFEKTEKEIKSLNQDITNLSLQFENLESKAVLFQHKILKLEEDIKYYNDNKDAYENLSTLKGELQAINLTLRAKQDEIKSCDNKVLEFMSEKGSATRIIEEAKEKIEQIRKGEAEILAYDLFVEATGPKGISYEVIKSMLPIINEEISKILSTIVDFEVFLEDDGDKLEIYIKHPKYEPRPLSMGSGAEKTIASMAVRLALLTISSLPRPTFFVLDEPATALDAEHMEGFSRLLQIIKEQFELVLLITHLDSLKDVVDSTIEINKEEGFAKVTI